MDIFELLETVQTHARNGLHYSQDPYDRERYQALLGLCSAAYGERLGQDTQKVAAQLAQELGHITPKVGAEAAIFNEQGEILLIERALEHAWGLPGGWSEPNERPVDTAVRETREETGLTVRPKQLVGIFSQKADARFRAHSLVAVLHLCDIVAGELTTSHESSDLRYWPIEDVPVWHGDHERLAKAAFAMWQDPNTPAASD